MDTIYFRRFMTSLIILVLLVASFFLLKPILLPIIIGFVLAFIFYPVYNLLYKLTKWPNFSATAICLILIALVLLPIWFFAPIVVEQTFKIYVSAQNTDFVGILKNIFPSIFASDQFSAQIGETIQSFITKTSNYFLNSFSNLIINFPTILLQALVVIFTFYFALRDRDKFTDYLRSISPFSKDIEDRLFKYSKEITASVLYGQVIIGIIEGIILAGGFFLFGVPNALLLSLLGIIAGVLPIIGPATIWIPVLVYLLIAGNNFAAFGILVVGLIASNIDHIIRPLLISRMTKFHSGVALIGMIGGLFMFGVMGLIIGPLILAYLIVIFEAYRERNTKEGISKLFVKED